MHFDAFEHECVDKVRFVLRAMCNVPPVDLCHDNNTCVNPARLLPFYLSHKIDRACHQLYDDFNVSLCIHVPNLAILFWYIIIKALLRFFN
jgi:hypothetical protein